MRLRKRAGAVGLAYTVSPNPMQMSLHWVGSYKQGSSQLAGWQASTIAPGDPGADTSGAVVELVESEGESMFLLE